MISDTSIKFYRDYLKMEKEQITNNIICENNNFIINELSKYFQEKKEITIIGKGETAQYIDDAIGIKQGIIFTNKKFFFCNDFWGLFGVEKYIKDIEYIFLPDYPHINSKTIKEKDFYFTLEYLKDNNFNGKVFIYQIQTTLSEEIDKKFTIISRQTTDVPISLFNKFFKITNFNLYGVGKGGLYHEDLKKLDYSISISKFPNLYSIVKKKYEANFNKDTSIYNKNPALTNYWKNFRRDLNITLN